MDALTHYLRLSEVKPLLGTVNDDASVEANLRDAIDEVSRILESATSRRFDRRVETRYFDAKPVSKGGFVDGDVLLLHDDCQSIISVTVGGVAVSNDVLTLLPHNFQMAGLMLRRTDYGSWFDAADYRAAIAVTAVWGYSGRWRNTGLTLNGSITASDVTLNVNGSNPVLEQEHVLKVDDEYLRVISDPSDNTAVTVERGFNGSTAVNHDNAAVVCVFEADMRVRRAAKRYLQWLKALEKSPLFGTITLGDAEFPTDMTRFPKDLKGLVLDLQRKGL